MDVEFELSSCHSSDVSLITAHEYLPRQDSGDSSQDVERKKDAESWSSSAKNPHNWSQRRKWMITLTACYMSSLAQIAPSAYSVGIDSMVIDLKSRKELVISGISLYTLAVAVFPLLLAPLGETVGRRNIYIVSYAIFFLFFLPVALAQNIQTVLVSRFIAGAAASVGTTMVGGTLSDLWDMKERCLPMAFFALSALFGTAIGPVVFSWAGRHDSWRWIHWTLLISGVPSAVLIVYVLRDETLNKIVMEQERYSSDHDDSRSEKTSVWQHIRNFLYKSSIRPLVFLTKEPITLALCLWIAFAWACLYGFLESLPLVFEPYGFVSATQGLAFTGLAIGALIGFALSILWDRQLKDPFKSPEQQLYKACVGGIIFSVGFFWYAWTAKPDIIHWVVPQIGTCIIMIGLFLFYVSIFVYLSECYGEYTASAIAAQGFLRNLVATAFPLFASQMYQGMTYPWASSLLGFVAALLAPVPFVLIRYGPELRKSSPFASQNMDK